MINLDRETLPLNFSKPVRGTIEEIILPGANRNMLQGRRHPCRNR